MTFSRRHLLVGTAAATTALAVGSPPAMTASPPSHRDATVVLEWNRLLLRIVRTPGAHPGTVHGTRSFAIMHAAISNAVSAVTGAGFPYLFRVNAERGAAAVAAAAAAGHGVLAALYPAMAGDLKRRLDQDLATVRDPRARRAGVLAGDLTARLLLALRANDGAAASPPPLAPGTAPGEYRPTPPGFAPAAFTHWPAVTPFVLDRADRFRPGPYPELTSDRYARATNEVKLLGRSVSEHRDADETTRARFWAGPIWNYWNEITQSVVAARRTDLVGAARVFALLNLSLADATIALFEAKYHYRIWRPITAIQLAGTDGNPATAPDPGWTPLVNTPADPAYPGAHSVISQAAVEILRDSFGPAQRVTATSEVLPGVRRDFGRFQDIAEEAGNSRVFAGVHTRLDHESGRRLGAGVARFVLDR